MNPALEDTVNQTVAALASGLGANLHSCCLYGSAVRGNAIEGVSDLNFLIVLGESTPTAHMTVAEILKSRPQIDPFVLALSGFERSARAFAPKFASIRRNYRLLLGTDVLASLPHDPKLEKFLCEQALRNLRLRLVFAFIKRHQRKGYDQFVAGNVTALFVNFSEVLRLAGATVPREFGARIELFEREFKIDGAVLRELLALKRAPRRLSDAEIIELHGRLFPVIDAVVRWVEKSWPA